MSTAQLLYLAQSLTEKRLADPQTVITYEQLMLYVHILKVLAGPAQYMHGSVLQPISSHTLRDFQHLPQICSSIL